MSLQPLNDRVVVEPFEAEERVGSIVIPDVAKQKPTRGKVLAVGPGKRLENCGRADMSVNVGDTVIFARYVGTVVELDGGKREVTIICESDVLAKMV